VKAVVFFITAFFLLTACGPKQIAEYTSNNQKIDSSIVSNSLDSLISPYREKLNEEMMQVIGYSDSNLLSYAPESPLSNFVADVVFQRGLEFLQQLDLSSGASNTFCMLNFGGIRSAINKGEITIATIYELMPFDNTIVVLQLRHDLVPELLKALIESGGQPVSNAQLRYDKNGVHFYIGGLEYTWTENVFVITSDYLANGGDKMDFFKNHMTRWDTGILIRDVLLDHISKQKTIHYTPIQGRIIL
jgi:2',3'-cyclic-nucleotide 2'-phosphodiesterase (5'-nucleotidase family)